ncbi:MAG: hypothetical protein JWP01_511 [Myxococcales bacterium]|nr:hypothetical protein [Myxococcales bacterium]
MATRRANSGRKTKAAEIERFKQMAEQATVDAYGESEQVTGWHCMLAQHLAVPFETTVLRATVIVERIDLRLDDHIVAICKQGRRRQAIEIRELPLPSPRPAGAEWIEAYRHWRRGW